MYCAKYFFLEINDPMDVLVGFDTSDQVDAKDFDNIKKFLSNMVNAYDISNDQVRIGLINFGSRQKVVLPLNAGNSKEKLLSAVQKVTKLGKIFRCIGFLFLNKSLFVF